MRTKKAVLNAGVSIGAFILGFLPNFIVRKVFLITLGTELLGLSSLYTNIISYLSIVEMGIGTAIIFSLYKPFAENNRIKVKGYLNYYSKFYKIAGCVILALGIMIIPFLNLFIKDNINMIEAKAYFVLFLINTFISYMFSYKICILNVSQEGYKVSIATTFTKVIIASIQYIFLKIYPSFYIYIIIQICINLLYYIIINTYINNKYSWLKETEGMINLDEKRDLTKNVKALFFHKIGSIVVFGTDNLVISSFINLKTVAKFNSYNMIIAAVQGVIGSAMNSITPSIGNLLAESDTENAYKVHKKLFFINFWIVSFIVITLFNTITQFVRVWLGNTQILDNFTVNIILINLYFQLMRGSVERFKDGSGNYYQDRYAAFFEAFINLFTSIILVNIIGLPGVFIGTLISNLMVVFWVKPRIAYKYVFNKSVGDYFKMYFKYLIIALVALSMSRMLTSNIKEINTIVMFLLNCSINILFINTFYLIIFRKNEEFNYFKTLFVKYMKKILKYSNRKIKEV